MRRRPHFDSDSHTTVYPLLVLVDHLVLFFALFCVVILIGQGVYHFCKVVFE